MRDALVLTKQELEEHDEKIANVVAQRVAKAIAKTGGVREPLPDVVSARWIINHHDIYSLGTTTLNSRHNEIIHEYKSKSNIITYKRGGIVYYDRRNFEAWLMGRELDKERRKKQDPRIAMLGGI